LHDLKKGLHEQGSVIIASHFKGGKEPELFR